jgi:acetolactate synthase-1/2/3 large subunit
VHADIDPAEISKNRVADVPIVGDAKDIITELIIAVRPARGRRRADLAAGGAGGQLADDVPARVRRAWRARPAGGDLPAGQLAGPEAIYTGVGQHQMWSAQFIKYENPNTWISSGGLGTMGFSVPAAMGAKVGMPDRTVWSIDGDGCFQMTNQELATCVINDIPIKIAIINNSSLGMVRQWQTLFYNERYSNTDLHTSQAGRRIPDFVKLAEAYGAVGLRCENPKDIDETIRKAMSIDDVPVVVDFVVHRDAMVWPMVPAGVSNDDILFARGVSPSWDRED